MKSILKSELNSKSSPKRVSFNTKEDSKISDHATKLKSEPKSDERKDLCTSDYTNTMDNSEESLPSEETIPQPLPSEEDSGRSSFVESTFNPSLNIEEDHDGRSSFVESTFNPSLNIEEDNESSKLIDESGSISTLDEEENLLVDKNDGDATTIVIDSPQPLPSEEDSGRSSFAKSTLNWISSHKAFVGFVLSTLIFPLAFLGVAAIKHQCSYGTNDTLSPHHTNSVPPSSTLDIDSIYSMTQAPTSLQKF